MKSNISSEVYVYITNIFCFLNRSFLSLIILRISLIRIEITFVIMIYEFILLEGFYRKYLQGNFAIFHQVLSFLFGKRT